MDNSIFYPDASIEGTPTINILIVFFSISMLAMQLLSRSRRLLHLACPLLHVMLDPPDPRHNEAAVATANEAAAATANEAAAATAAAASVRRGGVGGGGFRIFCARVRRLLTGLSAQVGLPEPRLSAPYAAG